MKKNYKDVVLANMRRQKAQVSEHQHEKNIFLVITEKTHKHIIFFFTCRLENHRKIHPNKKKLLDSWNERTSHLIHVEVLLIFLAPTQFDFKRSHGKQKKMT